MKDASTKSQRLRFIGKIMNEFFIQGYDAYRAGVNCIDNPYNWIDGHDMHPDEYFQWQNGWYDAETDHDNE